MADQVWQGSTNDWDTAGNWDNGPVLDSEDVFITGGSNQSIAGITLGAAGDALGVVSVHEDYTGDIGSTGDPVICVSGSLLYASRTGRLYWSSSGTMSSVTLRQSSGRSDAVYLDGGTITVLRIQNASGGVILASGLTCTLLEMTNSPNCVVTVQSGVTLTTARVDGGGIIDTSSAITTVHMSGPNSKLIRQAASQITTLNMYGGTGSCVVEDTASGTVPTLYATGPGALFDGRKNKNPAVVIGGTAGTVSNRARITLDNSMNSYTATLASDGTAVISGGSNVAIVL